MHMGHSFETCLSRSITKKIPVKIIKIIGYLETGEPGNGEIFTILKKNFKICCLSVQNQEA